MKLLVTAEQFGYGPIATCLNVVKELYKYPDIEMTFLGTGIAIEQAKMTKYFKNIIECKTYDKNELEKFKDIFFKHDVILCSENIPGARFALSIGMKNVYYIDNLMWMWDQIEDGIENLRGYIISEILPCRENFERIGKKIKNPVFVGPLREINVITQDKTTENKLIINIGGAEAFIIDTSIVISFYNKLINEILNNKSLSERFDKIIVCGGSGVINNININNTNNKIIVKTLSNEEYLKELDTCSHLIMASGLGNFVESIWRNKNIMYLPPVNYSQLLQLNYYKEMDMGFELLNWSDFNFYKEIPTLLNENDGVNQVIDNVKKYIELDANDTTVKNSVEHFLENNQTNYFEKRISLTNMFSKNASKKVADLIYNQNKEV